MNYWGDCGRLVAAYAAKKNLGEEEALTTSPRCSHPARLRLRLQNQEASTTDPDQTLGKEGLVYSGRTAS
jgi:hypothetical protein